MGAMDCKLKDKSSCQMVVKAWTNATPGQIERFREVCEKEGVKDLYAAVNKILCQDDERPN